MRKRKLYLNTGAAILREIITIICGFVLPRYIIGYYGSEINGLVASITQFLGFISFLEMGIGPVIQSNLYKPLARKDNDQISKILVSANKFFKKLSYILVAYICVLIVAVPFIVEGRFDFVFTTTLIISIGFNTFSQYYFGITNQLLLNADQNGYVQMLLAVFSLSISTIVSVMIMKLGGSIQLVKLSTSLIYLIRPVGQNIYISKHYRIDRHIELSEEPIKQKWNGFAQHVAAVVTGNTDVTILTLFSTLGNVSVYTVYFNIVNGLSNAVLTLATGLEALWGNMIANHENKHLLETFTFIEWAFHYLCTILFSITSVMIVPFIRIYTKGITDQNYLMPAFSLILVLAYYMFCLRVPYFRIIKAAGHYKETQNGAFINAALNIVLSVILVIKFGIIGVAIGTLVAMTFHTCYFVWYLSKNILKRGINHYIIHLIIDAISFVTVVFFGSRIVELVDSYYGWVLLAIKVSAISFLIVTIVNVIPYREYIKYGIKRIRKGV